ncbi:hypothetical protein N431DRAFT_195222 [Stipitochalara longipes BDJ]|nr:hypothetical protein N431DRAFT_195222 [Stipitochalara longipes BDJ]
MGPLLDSSFSQIPGSKMSPIGIFKGASKPVGGRARWWAESFVESIAEGSVSGLLVARRSRSLIVRFWRCGNVFRRTMMIVRGQLNH